MCSAFHFRCVVVFIVCSIYVSQSPFFFCRRSQLLLGHRNCSHQRLSLVLLLIVFPVSSVLDQFFSLSKPALVVLVLRCLVNPGPCPLPFVFSSWPESSFPILGLLRMSLWPLLTSGPSTTNTPQLLTTSKRMKFRLLAYSKPVV